VIKEKERYRRFADRRAALLVGERLSPTSFSVAPAARGQLKLAHEHSSRHVLRLMRKPGFEKFEEFLTAFDEISREAGKEQYVIPYLMSAFPGCTEADMRELAGEEHGNCRVGLNDFPSAGYVLRRAVGAIASCTPLRCRGPLRSRRSCRPSSGGAS
jgi:hypothetical protein